MRSVFAVALLAVAAVAVAAATAAAAPASGETLLVVHKWDESLGAYDAATGKPRGGTIKLGAVPHEMILSADGRRLFVTNYGVKTYTDTAPGAAMVSIVDLGARRKTGEIPLGDARRPHGIALGRTSGRLYVTVDFPPAVLALDPSAPAARAVTGRYPIDGKLPHMLAVRGDESAIYVANSGSGTVTVLRPKAPAGAARAKNIPVAGVPMGLALSHDEKTLYLANRDGNALVVIDTVTERVAKTVPLPGAPARVEPIPGGNLLAVSLIDAGDLALVDTRTFTVTTRRHIGDRAEGLFIDPHGKFACISVQAENKVVKLALPSLEKLMEFPTPARPDPIVSVPSY